MKNEIDFEKISSVMKSKFNRLPYLRFLGYLRDCSAVEKWFREEEIAYIAAMPDSYYKALTIIGRIYGEKMDRSGNPQSRHFFAVSEALDTETKKTVGLLHDVVEDGYLTLGALRLFEIEEEIIFAIDLLTRNKKLYTYDEYIKKRILPSNNLTVLEVKRADMINNQSYERVKDLPTEEARQKALHKYKPYIPLLEEKIAELKGQKLERKRN